MIENDFIYCPLIWMFGKKANMQRVEKIQYKTLQIVYNNYMVSRDDLIALDNKLKIHQSHYKFWPLQ